jgi:hypothetical protein
MYGISIQLYNIAHHSPGLATLFLSIRQAFHANCIDSKEKRSISQLKTERADALLHFLCPHQWRNRYLFSINNIIYFHPNFILDTFLI